MNVCEQLMGEILDIVEDMVKFENRRVEYVCLGQWVGEKL